ncbi:AraC family transcriptional regulator [Chryseolinea sp. H1M3-3]|uniref:helix-turn-helix transcriptional regulator n=1 Tax=Chryseolinea sp. H1M3-3 TaxID=3034144 RepID=UPI0023ECAE58|nr:AraC family transcriptional regulator [Chryseolinea sp. H1M3-3]
MKLRRNSMDGATVADFQERLTISEIKSIHPESPARFNMHAASEIGSLQVEQLFNRHFSVSKVDMHFKYNTLIDVKEVPTDKVGFYMLDHGRGGIPLFGETHYSESSYVSGGDCYIAFNPSLNEIHRFDAQTSKPFYIEVTADYFASLLEGGDNFTGSLREKIYNREFFGLKTVLKPAHSQLAASIFNCPIEGPLGNLMIEGILHQFVALQLSTYVQPTFTTACLSARDRDTMHAVKDYLHQNFQKNHSLIELSKQFGINQNKLKKSFKELFGVPVIEYLYNLKMENARTMLYDEGMYVSEVASVVGYKNANHFATAFKRKFGVNPSKV